MSEAEISPTVDLIILKFNHFSPILSANEKICENIHIFANEPSLAMYRIQENVRKVVPLAVEIRKNDEATMKGKLQGACFDLEYSLESVQSIIAADESFAATQDMLKNAIFLKQQLKCEESKRRRDNSNRDSAFKRFSAHIPIEYVVRETTTRVENIIGMNTAAEAQAIQRSHTTL